MPPIPEEIPLVRVGSESPTPPPPPPPPPPSGSSTRRARCRPSPWSLLGQLVGGLAGIGLMTLLVWALRPDVFHATIRKFVQQPSETKSVLVGRLARVNWDLARAKSLMELKRQLIEAGEEEQDEDRDVTDSEAEEKMRSEQWLEAITAACDESTLPGTEESVWCAELINATRETLSMPRPWNETDGPEDFAGSGQESTTVAAAAHDDAEETSATADAADAEETTVSSIYLLPEYETHAKMEVS